MDTHTAVAADPRHEPEPMLNVRQRWLLGLAAASTGGAAFWSAGDLIYNGHFAFHGAWWVLVMIAIAGWTMLLIETDMKRSRENQAQIMDEVHLIRLDVDALIEAVREYGDMREIAGHARANGVRHLHTVE